MVTLRLGKVIRTLRQMGVTVGGHHLICLDNRFFSVPLHTETENTDPFAIRIYSHTGMGSGRIKIPDSRYPGHREVN